MIANKSAKALVVAWNATENIFMGLKCKHDVRKNTIFEAIFGVHFRRKIPYGPK